MISDSQLCKNRLENVTNLSNTILLPIVAQLYEFHGKSEKLKKEKLWIATNKKVTKKLCRKIHREIIITYTALAHSEPSQTFKMDPLANMAEY